MALECLGRAIACGYRNTNELRIEPALDPLRNRPDFKKLMAELEKSCATTASEAVTSRNTNGLRLPGGRVFNCRAA